MFLITIQSISSASPSLFLEIQIDGNWHSCDQFSPQIRKKYVCMCIHQSMLTYASSHTHTHTHIHVGTCVEARNKHWPSSVYQSQPYFLRQGLYLDYLARNPQGISLPQNRTSTMSSIPPLLAFSWLLVLEHPALY